MLSPRIGTMVLREREDPEALLRERRLPEDSDSSRSPVGPKRPPNVPKSIPAVPSSVAASAVASAAVAGAGREKDTCRPGRPSGAVAARLVDPSGFAASRGRRAACPRVG
jgi:hypothetical protein